MNLGQLVDRACARVRMLVVLVTAFTMPIGAQGVIDSMPAQPDSALTPGEGDAEFASWLRGQVDAGRREAPILLQTGRFEVLAMTPLARASLAPDSVFAPMVATCAETMKLAEAQVIQLASLRPWKAFDEAASRVPAIAFAIVPSHAAPVNCGASGAALHAALGRGVRFVRTAMYNQFNDARRAELWVNGANVPPALSGRSPVTQVAQSALRQDATTQLRLYVTPDQLAPDDDGRLPQVELRVWNASDDAPERIEIPREALHRLWDSELRWRAARITNASLTTSARPTLPAPHDAVLRTALSRLSSGDLRGAALLAVDRLADESLGDKDRLTGQLILGLAFDAEGDAAAARLAFADAVATEPCLTFDAAVDPRYARMLDGPRPESRCTARPLPLVAAISLVPGFGQYSSGRRLGMSLAVVGSVAASFMVAQGRYAEGREAFAEYEAVNGFETGVSPANRLMNAFNRAEGARLSGNNLVRIGAGIWVLAGIEAIVYEYRHQRALRSVQGFGGTSSRFGVTPVPGGLGLSVALFR